jgi:hypothetical protein
MLIQYERVHMSKYKQIRVNFTHDDHAKIDQLAELENMSIAEYIRKKLDLDSIAKVPRKRKVRIDKRDIKKEDPKKLFFLANISNNINQIAKHCNSTHTIDVQVLNAITSIQMLLEEEENQNDNIS